MDKQSIANAITARVESSKTVNYGAWRIGLTHDPRQRAQEHKSDGEDIQHWQHWQADSLADAEAIEAHFINTKKMKGGTGGDLNPRSTVYVYIF